MEYKTNILKRQLTSPWITLLFHRLAFRHSARSLRFSVFLLCITEVYQVNTFWKKGRESENGLKSCTISCFHGNLCSLSHMCALSLQLMALFTGILAPSVLLLQPAPQRQLLKTHPPFPLSGPLNCVLSALGLQRYEL